MSDYAYDYEIITTRFGSRLLAIRSTETVTETKMLDADELREYFGKSEWLDREDEFVHMRMWAAEYMTPKRAAILWEAE